MSQSAESSLRQQLAELRLRLEEAEDTLAAIRSGEIDAVVVNAGTDNRVYTLAGADRIYRVLFDTLGEGVLTVDGEGRICYSNGRFAEMVGTESSRVVGAPLEQFFASNKQPAAQLLRDICQQGRRGQREIELLCADGARLATMLTVSPVLLGPGESDLFAAVFADISDLKATQDALHAAHVTLEANVAQRTAELRQSEERVRILAEASPDLIWSALPSGVLDYVNPAWEAYTGGQLKGSEPKHWCRWCHPEETESILQAVEKAAGNTAPFEGEFRYRSHDGQYRWFWGRFTPVRDDKGQLFKWVGVSRDITERIETERERRELEAQVQQAAKDESLAVLAGGVAHDFNNLLVGIIGNAELLLLDLPEDSEMREMAHSIELAGRHAADLAKQMLAFSGRGRFELEAVPLDRLVKDIDSLLRASVPRSVRLQFSLEAPEAVIDADPTQLRQVLMNLALNAAEAIGEGQPGTIVIRTRMASPAERSSGPCCSVMPEASPLAVLEVEDTGMGMSAETQTRIFDPFFSTKFTGRGLGLAAVRGIVRGHHGVIRVQSAEGKGTTMQVYLPCTLGLSPSKRAELLSDRPAHASRALQGGKVLVVDDEPLVRELVRRVLTPLQVQVLSAENGLEAVQIVRKAAHELTAVILDLTMPVMGGEEALRQIRKLAPQLPVLLASGYNQRQSTAHLAGLAPSGFIAKPFDGETLTRALVQVLRIS